MEKIFLNVNGKDYEAKCNFLFDTTANARYGEVSKDTGKKESGFSAIYTGLLGLEPVSLLEFWDCALEHYRKDKPTKEEIEAALEERIEQDGDVLPAIQEAFNMIDESGFFKQKAASFWKNVERMKKIGTNDEKEAREMEMSFGMMEEARQTLKNEING